jgi:uncharacterized membrane protein YcaP (DUF421 family)
MNQLDLVFHSIFRTGISFIILMLVSVWIGKQINSHNNHYNFGLSITIGAFIANMGFDTNINFFEMVCAFLTLVLMYFIISVISTKSRNMRLWLSGEPTVIIEKGKILDRNMKKIRYSLDDLNQQLREQGIFDIFEVEFALLEVSGKLSVMKKTIFQPVSKRDVKPNIENQSLILPKELIMDGKVVEKNFTSKYSLQWLKKELKIRNLKIKEVQYAVLSSNGTIFIDLYKDQIASPLDIE